MIFIIIIVLLIASGYGFMHLPKFGRLPTGERLGRINKSSHYRNGKFHNINKTPNLAEGESYTKVMWDFFFNKSKRSSPADIIPSKKTNLLKLDPGKNVLVWFGHSSYFMQIDGRKMLVDPVFSGSASPVKFTTRSFAGSNVYDADDIPEIDYLFISHDHWDHLDYETVLKLKPKIKKIITGLGVAEHLEHWGFDTNIIFEKDWNEEIILDEGFIVNTVPARHFSGRGFKRCPSLWSSFVLRTPGKKIYMGGDSGFDTHFEKIGNEFGPFDLAVLECGQYNKSWKYIHMMPEEVVQAAKDLKAEKVLPVHWAKFNLAPHAWDEPIIRLTKESEKVNLSILHPMIGEEVDLDNQNNFSRWWEKVN